MTDRPDLPVTIAVACVPNGLTVTVTYTWEWTDADIERDLSGHGGDYVDQDRHEADAVLGEFWDAGCETPAIVAARLRTFAYYRSSLWEDEQGRLGAWSIWRPLSAPPPVD
jgi:hypothetical protein